MSNLSQNLVCYRLLECSYCISGQKIKHMDHKVPDKKILIACNTAQLQCVGIYTLAIARWNVQSSLLHTLYILLLLLTGLFLNSLSQIFNTAELSIFRLCSNFLETIPLGSLIRPKPLLNQLFHTFFGVVTVTPATQSDVACSNCRAEGPFIVHAITLITS